MSFIDLPIENIDDIQEDQPVPEGEYTLVITDAKEKMDEASGCLKGILVICEIQGHDGAANVLHNISIPLPDDPQDKVGFKLKFMKRFIQQFNIPVKGNQLNLQDFIGKSAKCLLVQKEYEGTVSNSIKLPPSK